MARRKKTMEDLPTIWRVSDELWDIFNTVLEERDPPAPTGRPRIDQRAALDGIIYRMRTGCQWHALPKEFGDYRSVHRTMQTWNRLGVMERIWAVLIEQCDELGGVDWQWQSADAAMGKARFGGITSAPTLRIAGKTAANAV